MLSNSRFFAAEVEIPDGDDFDMDRRIITVIEIMRKSIAARPSVRSLSQSVCLSPARLRQLFRAETGLSPIQYLIDLRMREAEKLLQTTFISIKEVAFLSGARDVSHFVRDFKSRHGLTPREFRSQSESTRKNEPSRARSDSE